MGTVETATCKRELVIEIPAEDVQREVERVTLTFQRRARVPGFRPGKTPASVIRQRFRDDIREQVLHNLIPEHFERRVREEHLELAGGPHIEDVHLEPETNEPLRFKAVFEVLPTFELKDYTELEVEVVEPAVSEEEVEATLKQLQEQQATFLPVEDRPLQDGDFALVSVHGKPESPETAGKPRTADQPPAPAGASGSGMAVRGKRAEPVVLDDVLCEIGGADTHAAFTENLRGAQAGEERSFTISYPEDFHDKRLASRTLLYTVRVNAIKQKQAPELNDEFARDLGSFNSLEEVRAGIRQNLLEEKRERAVEEAKEQLLNRLVELHDFPVPESLVEKQVQSRMERAVRQLASKGVNPAKLELDWSRLRASQREAALRDARAGLILERIADREDIQVSEQELQQHMDLLARQAARGKDPAVVRARLTKEGVADRIKSRLHKDKALDFVYRNAKKIPSGAGPQAVS